MDLRLVVQRECPAFPAVIDGDGVSVDGFDDAVKSLTLVFLGGNSARCRGQADNNKDECQVGFHEIGVLVWARYYFD